MAEVELVPMTDQERADWMAVDLDKYTASRVRAGETPDQAAEIATRQYAEYFPEGRPAPGHRIFTVRQEGRRIGILWVGPHPQRADDPNSQFVYDIEIDPDSRGAGLGRATLAAAEDLALEQGATQLTLNVFGDNTVARNLYRSAGFTEVAVTMSKQLEPRS